MALRFRGTRTDPSTDLADARETAVHDRPIGAILQQAGRLSEAQLDQVLTYQQEHGVRFGDAAVAMRLVRPDEVMRALSQQFHYHHRYGSEPNGTFADELFVANYPFSDEVEAFRDLRTQLVMGPMDASQSNRLLGVLSPDVGDGKTFIVANLAVAFSQLPGRTLLVDCDMRSPRMHRVFGVDSSHGLSGVLSGRSEANVISPVQQLPNLYVMPVGAVPPNPLELLQAPAFTLLMTELCTKFDYVLVDTPAAVHGADSWVIAARCGALLVVGRKDHTRSASLKSMMKRLARGPQKVVGVVMNEH